MCNYEWRRSIFANHSSHATAGQSEPSILINHLLSTPALAQSARALRPEYKTRTQPLRANTSCSIYYTLYQRDSLQFSFFLPYRNMRICSNHLYFYNLISTMQCDEYTLGVERTKNASVLLKIRTII